MALTRLALSKKLQNNLTTFGRVAQKETGLENSTIYAKGEPLLVPFLIN